MGFDLSRLLGLASTQVLCLNTVQVKTRSSDSFTSELKDFVLGRFVTCSSSVSTEIHSGSNSATPPHPKIADETTPGSIVVGSTIHDLATVTGTAGVELVGQVTFRLFGNTNPTCNPAGTAPTLLGPFALPSGSGNIKSVESSDVPNVPPGALAFQAVYHDTRSPAIFPDSTSGCEQLTVFKRNAIIVTQILDAAGNDITGTTVFAATSAHDKATVSCTPIASCVGAPTPTGTVIFRRFSTTNCSGTPVDVQTVALSAGVAETSPPISVTIPGLSFNASYVDDAVYNAAGPSVCEPLTVIKRECTVTTAVLSGGINVTNSLVPVGTVIVDQANIAGSGPAPIPTPAGGTVTFTRFSSGNCTGSIDLVTTALLSGGVASSPTFTMPSNAFSYVVTYDGTNDPNYNNCGATVCEPVCALQARTLP